MSPPAAEPDDPAAAVISDAAVEYYGGAENLTEVTFGDDVVVFGNGGYECFENGSFLVPLNEGGNATLHSPEDLDEKVHKVRGHCGGV